jgi:hypothetical protein
VGGVRGLQARPDPTCAPFETVRCHTFITESTFGLPIYRWQEPRRLFESMNAWWRANAAEGRASVVFAYAFGKAQRILASIDASIGPILVHGAVESLNRAYREAAWRSRTRVVTEMEKGFDPPARSSLAPPSAQSTPWLKRFGDYADAFARAGWRSAARAAARRGPGLHPLRPRGLASLNRAIAEHGRERVFVTHGQVPPWCVAARARARRATDGDANSKARETGAGRNEALRRDVRGARLEHQHAREDRGGGRVLPRAAPRDAAWARGSSPAIARGRRFPRGGSCSGLPRSRAAAVALRGVLRIGRRPRRDHRAGAAAAARGERRAAARVGRGTPPRACATFPRTSNARASRPTGWSWNDQRFVFTKLITGNFRVGVSATLAIRGIAQAYGLDPKLMAHRLMGEWSPGEAFWAQATDRDSVQPIARARTRSTSPPAGSAPESLGDRDEWLAEWKWDGIRSQLIRRGDVTAFWSRGEERSRAIPGAHGGRAKAPDCVIDGESAGVEGRRVMPFAALQKRLGRKNPGKKVMADSPVIFLAFDLLEWRARTGARAPLEDAREAQGHAAHDPRRHRASTVSPVVRRRLGDARARAARKAARRAPRASC